MPPRLTLILCIALANCGASDRAADGKERNQTVDHATVVKLDLTSDAFRDGQPIPPEYGCDGADQSPPLAWGAPPPGTRSFALVVDDPDAPGGTFRHWGAYDIPADTRSLARGQSAGKQATNDFGKAGYGGPCPPKGHGTHHYHFKLFALDTDHLDAGPKVQDVETAAMRHALARGELIGTYERK